MFREVHGYNVPIGNILCWCWQTFRECFGIPSWRRSQMPHEQFEWSGFGVGKVEQLAFVEYNLVAVIIALDDSSTTVIHE